MNHTDGNKTGGGNFVTKCYLSPQNVAVVAQQQKATTNIPNGGCKATLPLAIQDHNYMSNSNNGTVYKAAKPGTYHPQHSQSHQVGDYVGRVSKL